MASENFAASLPAADAATLARIDGCESVDLLLPDTNGVLRGKRVTGEALGKIYRDGVCLPMSLIATDITGNTVEETGLGYAIGDADRICRRSKARCARCRGHRSRWRSCCWRCTTTTAVCSRSHHARYCSVCCVALPRSA